MSGVTSGQVLISLPDLAEAMVAAAAPQELELLPSVTAAWQSGELGRRTGGRWTGGSVGSGLSPDVLTDIVYPLLTGTFAEVLGATATSWWSRRRARRRRTPPAPVSINLAQAEELRLACYAHAVTAGMSKPRARLVSDAMYGCLLRSQARGETDPGAPGE
jgi:hypothetical protein